MVDELFGVPTRDNMFFSFGRKYTLLKQVYDTKREKRTQCKCANLDVGSHHVAGNRAHPRCGHAHDPNISATRVPGGVRVYPGCKVGR